MLTLSVIYFVAVLLLAIYGIHRGSFVFSLLRRPYRNSDVKVPEKLPKVCLQLPLYNEPRVVGTLLQAVSQMKYPRELLEVQVLDDSTDETSSIVDREATKLRADGLNISVIRRKNRDGFKAGALQKGVSQTDAEFLAVFDADFLPPADFLLKTVPQFEELDVGFVQARWGYTNRNKNLLTRAQAMLLDGHFILEHTARFQLGAFFNFNGTAGVWRRSAILDAGGWQGDTLTEDKDLSYRVQLLGWRGIYLRDLVCMSELPENIQAFKSQQFRWAKGSAQTFRKIGFPLLRSNATFRQKFEGFFHLSEHFSFLLILLVAILLIPVAAYRSEAQVGAWFEVLVCIGTFFSLTVFYSASQLFQGRKVNAVDVILAMALGIGISGHCAIAVLSGLRSSVGEFVRTPKFGAKGDASLKRRFRLLEWATYMRQHSLELAMTFYLSVGGAYLLYKDYTLSIPFVLLILFGYTMVIVAAARSTYE